LTNAPIRIYLVYCLTMDFQYVIEPDFQAGTGDDDIRNVRRREGLRLRYIGRIYNKRLFIFANRCTCIDRWYYRLQPLSEYMTPEEYQNVILEHENGDELSKIKLKYNPFAYYPTPL
jgi:hypothetical protein